MSGTFTYSNDSKALVFGCLLAFHTLGITVDSRATETPETIASGTIASSIAGELTNRVHPAWQDFEPRFVEQQCPFGELDGIASDQIDCGYVLVPEDRTAESSRLIRLAVMKFDSSSQDAPAGAVLRLDGGPGGPSLYAERARYYGDPENDSLRRIADVIFHDQRGIGFSDSAICRAVPDVYQYGVPMGEEGYVRFRARMKACLAEARQQGTRIDAYSTWHNAMDVRDLRRALGYESWNLFGVSYGAQLAQAVMEVDPEGVRSAILDSAAPASPGPRGGWGAVGYGFRSSLEAVDLACSNDPVCSRQFPSLAESWLAAIRDFDRHPLELDGLDERRFLGGKAIVDAELAALFSFQLLYDESYIGDLPIFVGVLEQRNESVLRSYLNQAAWPIDHAVGQGMRLIANCRGSAPLTSSHWQEYRRQEPELSRWLRYHDTTETCDAAYAIRPDPAVRQLETSIPVLVGSGTFDPVTPPSRAREILPGLANVTYVEFPYSGHGVLLEGGCARDLSFAFLRNPRDTLDSSCAAAQAAPRFTTRYRMDGRPLARLQAIAAGDRPWFLITLSIGLVIAIVVSCMRLAAAFVDRQWTALHTPILLNWLGAAAALGSLVAAALMLLGWIESHPIAAPSAVPYRFSLAGTMAVAGFVLALAGSISWRQRAAGSRLEPSQLIGQLLYVGLTIATVLLLQSTGFGV